MKYLQLFEDFDPNKKSFDIHFSEVPTPIKKTDLDELYQYYKYVLSGLGDATLITELEGQWSNFERLFSTNTKSAIFEFGNWLGSVKRRRNTWPKISLQLSNKFKKENTKIASIIELFEHQYMEWFGANLSDLEKPHEIPTKIQFEPYLGNKEYM